MNPRLYYMWTIGCQMNVADSERVAALLEQSDLRPVDAIEQADVVILNSCVIRQGAEDKVSGELGTLKGLKRRKPGLFIGLMGCMVTDDTRPALAKRFPQVDVFFNVLETDLLLEKLVGGRQTSDVSDTPDALRHTGVEFGAEAGQVWYPGLPAEFLDAHASGPAKYIPVIYGCNMNCSFCIVPSRRGRERSRPVGEVLAEAQTLARHEVREITLLGQTVDAYGHDLPPLWSATTPVVAPTGRGVATTGVPDTAGQALVALHAPNQGGFARAGAGASEGPARPDLADLLAVLSDVPEIWRLRYLTSHPLWMTDRIIAATASLPKVCPCINIPVQSGHDDILKAMRRGYTVDGYRRLVARIRAAIPGVAVTTDLIVGFPGETDEHFAASYHLLEEIAFDVVHVAAFSPRPGTVAAALPDDVTHDEKMQRLHAVEELQEGTTRRINQRLVGSTVDILVEGTVKGKWMGRTRTDKIVFFEDAGQWTGKLVNVHIAKAGPWSLQGTLAP